MPKPPDTSTEIPAEDLEGFLVRHRLPEAFRDTATSFYLPLAARLPSFREGDETLLLGINGAQGTGKSTLADFLDIAAASLFGWRSAVLSIDDFYLTLAERRSLATSVHPLLETRGVPGTHDTGMLDTTLDGLVALATEERARLPRFDKASDDRAPEHEWPVVTGPIDMIVLEGWCVGSEAETNDALAQPVNGLERDEDADGNWRGYANEKLKSDYAPIFDRLDALVFLAAPSFEAVYRWRLEQEQKLASASGGRGKGLMDADGVARFIRFYERITRHNLAALPKRADAVLTLDEEHAVTACRYKS
ncbi:MAG: kinase [Woeseiaceae bacterium]|nr:kinase [Woeseiaceae bacterium]